MGLDLSGQRHPRLRIAEGIEVSSVEGEGSVVRSGTAAISEVEEGLFMGVGPGLCLVQPGTTDGSPSAHPCATSVAVWRFKAP